MDKAEIKNCSIVVLAAGNSGRMGRPKLLMKFRDQTLLSHAVEAAIGTGISRILVVTGGHATEIIKVLKPYAVKTVLNEHWSEGMSRSVKTGLKEVISLWPDTDAVIFMVADQPYISSSVLNELMETQRREQTRMTAAGYKHTIGTPALFHHSVFPSFEQLHGDEGAKKILNSSPSAVAVVPFEGGDTDIDTPAEYDALIRSSNPAHD